MVRGGGEINGRPADLKSGVLTSGQAALSGKCKVRVRLFEIFQCEFTQMDMI